MHGQPPEDVHFHEVGALDAIADVVGVCAGVVHLGLERVVVSEVSVGGGTVSHRARPPAGSAAGGGRAPAWGAELRGSCRPRALHAHGRRPADHAGRRVGSPAGDGGRGVGVGAGARDPEGHANVLRLLVGVSTGSTDGRARQRRSVAVLLETNVDDLDPRLWPGVLAALLEAGASDAWLTPILMKKGRPGAHAQRSGRRPTGPPPYAARSTGRPPPSACASSGSASTSSTGRWLRSRSTGTRSRSRWPGSTERWSTCSRSSRTSPLRRTRWAVRSRR